jgi:thioesterase domain-containing protein/acyl carrier protein
MLRRHEAIAECAAISREIDGELLLIAYYKKKDKIVLSGDLREFLISKLPDYMIPSYFVQLEQFPLTQTGKIDRTRLPEPEFTAAGAYKAPRNKLEENLARIWQEVLNKSTPIGIADNFFEIGGHSLKAAVVTARMNDEFKVKVPLMEFFKTPTVEAMARYIRHAGIENIARGDERAIPIKIESRVSRNLFLIHDGTGAVDGYVEFCKHSGEEYNCWGIRADRLETLAQRDITIEGLAESYIETMKKVQPDGPYFIAGWSLGGTIAFEIAARLELMNEQIGFLGLIDSPPPYRRLRKHAAEADLESEGGGDPDRSGISRCLSNARALYTPQRKINTPLHYFAAGGSRRLKKERWGKYTHTRIEYHEVAGDHFSIFKMPDVADFVVLFEKVFKHSVDSVH